MSYPRDLDEYSDDELEAERQRRVKLRARGQCPYCRQDFEDPPCRHPEQHRPLLVLRGRAT